MGCFLMSNYPDDIHQYDNDPRSPFYDSSFDDAVEAEVQERLPAILADRMEECYYGEDWLEDIDYQDVGHMDMAEVAAKIMMERPVSQEEINKVFTYFIDTYMTYIKRMVDNDMDDITETVGEAMKDEAECMRYGI